MFYFLLAVKFFTLCMLKIRNSNTNHVHRPNPHMLRKVLQKRSFGSKNKSLLFIGFFISILLYLYLDISSYDKSSKRQDRYIPGITEFPFEFCNEHLRLFIYTKAKRTLNNHSLVFLILSAGDIEINPGPIKNPCAICLKPVASRHKAVSCDSCNLWAHIKCTSMSTEDYKALQTKDNFNFVCARCLQCELPFIENEFTENRAEPLPILKPNYLHDLDIAKEKGLKIGHLNVNSILNKLDYIKILIKHFDVLAISESKLNSNSTDAELSIQDYNLERLDRDSNGGGVMLYCHTKYSMIRQSKMCNQEFESLWVKLKSQNSKPIFLSVTYRSPSIKNPVDYTKRLCSYMTLCMKSIPFGTEVFCVGDFNADYSTNCALTSLLKDFSRSCNLKQLIDKPTRITETTSSIIDLIFTNSNKILEYGSITCGISDHNIIYCNIKFKKPKYEPKSIKFRSFKNFDKTSYVNDLLDADWSNFFLSKKVDKAVDIFNQILLEIADKHAPVREHRIKGQNAPWITDDFLSAIRERDFLLKKATKFNRTEDWNDFRKKRNNVNKLKNNLKRTYYNRTLRESKNNPRELWKKIRELIPDQASTKITELNDEVGSIINENKGIANHLNSFFVNIGAELASKFPKNNTSQIRLESPKKMFRFKPFTVEQIAKILKSLDTKKSSGTDRISVRILKEGSSVLIDKLLFIYNLSITTSTVPRLWKIKQVSPIYKSGERNVAGNYRPISVMSTTMKIFEKLVYGQFMEFILENKILHNNQSGFRQGFSTSTAALDVKDYIVECLKADKFVCAVLLDLSKAFDTVDHTILLKKLYCYGFQDLVFTWCESYLSGRKQTVYVNGTISESLKELPYGVPQGSVLGPLFFLLYINDINIAIKKSYFHLYADDTVIIQSGNNTTDLIANMEKELTSINEWLTNNKLTPNKKKCETIFFANPHNIKKCSELTVNFCGNVLVTKPCVKYLGIYFDSTLSWKRQIKEIRRKVNFKLSKIRPLAKYVDPSIIIMLIKSFTYPYIHYCSPTWSSAAPHLIKKLQSTFDKTQFFTKGMPKTCVRNRIDLDIAIQTFKAIHGLAPSYVSARITLSSAVHDYNTRQSSSKNIFCVPKCNKLSFQSFSNVSARVWNSLTLELKQEKSLLIFKNKCKKHFLNN